MNTKRKLIALLAIATLVSIVNASVFVYYPISLEIEPQEPPVIFEEGSNAGKTDLRGNTIIVNIEKETSLEITVHPTLQRNYYYDVAKIVNKDGNNAYYIKFRVTQPVSDSRVSEAYLIVNDTKIDLMSSELQPSDWIELGASKELRVDLYIVLIDYSGGSITVFVDLIITPTQTTETPPTPPT